MKINPIQIYWYFKNFVISYILCNLKNSESQRICLAIANVVTCHHYWNCKVNLNNIITASECLLILPLCVQKYVWPCASDFFWMEVINDCCSENTAFLETNNSLIKFFLYVWYVYCILQDIVTFIILSCSLDWIPKQFFVLYSGGDDGSSFLDSFCYNRLKWMSNVVVQSIKFNQSI